MPVIVSAIGGVLFTIGWRETFKTARETSFALYTVLILAGLILSITGQFLMLMVMGGAARNLVRHLLWREPITMRETFRNLRDKFWTLLFATLIVGFVLLIVSTMVFYGWVIAFALAMIGATLVGAASQAAGFVVGIVLCLAVTVCALWLFFMVAVRFACVPQVITIEGQGVFSAIGRSGSLGGGNTKRFAALVLFSIFATYSALMVLFLPLGWYAYINGIEFYSFEPDALPLWYSVTTQVIWQISIILLAPIWMLGLSILYVDERVRSEAYDIELMAARQLGEMPALANPSINPLRPALVTQSPPAFAQNYSSKNITTLGLR